MLLSQNERVPVRNLLKNRKRRFDGDKSKESREKGSGFAVASGILAGLQIELEEDVDCLEFLQEYSLGTKPMEIDVLIRKKKKNESLKDMGRFQET